jgi:hypothetical protein
MAHSHWSNEPYSCVLRIEDLPASLSSGQGRVDFIALIMPIKPKPKVYEINVSIVRRAQRVKNIDDFNQEFCAAFKSEWNKN